MHITMAQCLEAYLVACDMILARAPALTLLELRAETRFIHYQLVDVLAFCESGMLDKAGIHLLAFLCDWMRVTQESCSFLSAQSRAVMLALLGAGCYPFFR